MLRIREVIYDMSVGYDLKGIRPNGTGLHSRNEGCLGGGGALP